MPRAIFWGGVPRKREARGAGAAVCGGAGVWGWSSARTLVEGGEPAKAEAGDALVRVPAGEVAAEWCASRRGGGGRPGRGALIEIRVGRTLAAATRQPPRRYVNLVRQLVDRRLPRLAGCADTGPPRRVRRRVAAGLCCSGFEPQIGIPRSLLTIVCCPSDDASSSTYCRSLTPCGLSLTRAA